jgi:Domain of unknown function (DUF2935)
VKPFIDLKHRMSEAQAKGKMRSLVWPDFFDHTALEAERFTKRLEQFSRGNAALDRGEVVDFWSKIMEDHAEFMAHLLDPQEEALIAAEARTGSGRLLACHSQAAARHTARVAKSVYRSNPWRNSLLASS